VVFVDNWPLALWPLILFGVVGAAATWFARQLR
jgi:hypothetical protein